MSILFFNIDENRMLTQVLGTFLFTHLLAADKHSNVCFLCALLSTSLYGNEIENLGHAGRNGDSQIHRYNLTIQK